VDGWEGSEERARCGGSGLDTMQSGGVVEAEAEVEVEVEVEVEQCEV
jgi:hypothetical protein